MPSLSRRSVALAPALAAALTLSSTLAAGAHTSPQLRVAPVSAAGQAVSGRIPFVARGLSPEVRRVAFLVDGHRRWAATRSPFRFGATGELDTRSLSNGTHTLSVRAWAPGEPARTASERIVVRNPIAVGGPIGGTPIATSPTPTATTTTPTTTTPPPTGSTSPLTSSGSVAFFNRETYAYSSALSLAAEAQRYQVMVLQATDGSLVAALHAANPHLKVLVYQHPYFSRVSDSGALTVCTSYQSDLANHPNWFLHTASGALVTTRSGGNYEMDMANPAYQQACIAHAVSLAKRYGFDGVFLDDIAASEAWEVPSGVVAAPYPTNAAWQSALTSMVNYASSTLHANGLLAIANLCGTTITPGLWQQWAAPLDGAEEESWTDDGSGLANDVWAWPRKLADDTWSEAHGKYVLLHSYNTTAAGNTFGLASMLLSANGLTSYSTSNANYTSDEEFYPDYTTAQQLGAPSAAYRVLSNGVYERSFQHGVVLVNPTAGAVSNVAIDGGALYSGDGLSRVSSVSLAPTSAVILTRVS